MNDASQDSSEGAPSGTPVDWKSIPLLPGLSVTFPPTAAQIQADQQKGQQNHTVLLWRMILGAIVVLPVVVSLIFVVFVAPVIMWFWPHADGVMFSPELSQWALGILGMIVGSAVTVSLGSAGRGEKAL